MTYITVEPTDIDTYRVNVSDEQSATTHEVTADPGDIDRFGEGAGAEWLIEASFRFLLDREPKESILSRFDLADIERYFPEFAEHIDDYL